MPTASSRVTLGAVARVAGALLLLGRVAAAQGIVLDVDATLVPSPLAGSEGSPPPVPVSCGGALSLPGAAAFTLHRDCALDVQGTMAGASMTATASRTLLTLDVFASVNGGSLPLGNGIANAHARIDDLLTIVALPGATPAANVVFTGLLTGDVVAVGGIAPEWVGPTAGAGTT